MNQQACFGCKKRSFTLLEMCLFIFLATNGKVKSLFIVSKTYFKILCSLQTLQSTPLPLPEAILCLVNKVHKRKHVCPSVAKRITSSLLRLSANLS